MEYIYRNNAGRFRLEPGVQTFLPPTATIVQPPPPGKVPSSVAAASAVAGTQATRRSPWFFPPPTSASGIETSTRELLLKSAALQESCPSILLLSGGGPPNRCVAAGTPGTFRKLHSSSAPNEGITGVDSVFSPIPSAAVLPVPAVDIPRRGRNLLKRRQSLSGGGPVHLENPERETRWYFKYFLGKGES